MIRKYRRATPEIPVFFILRCLKMHNSVNELILCNSEHVHKLNTQLSTKTKRNQLYVFKTAQMTNNGILGVARWYLLRIFFSKTFTD